MGAAKNRWRALIWIVPSILVLLVLAVVGARVLRDQPSVQSFMATYPGTSRLPAGAPVGFPAWLAWQHFLSAFFILLIIRSGLQVRYMNRPTDFWTRTNTGRIRTRNPPIRLSLTSWFHLSLDVVWILNGIVFYVLLFSTGQWERIVPTSWDVVPNAISTAIQYASLHWPVANGWVNYNALQVLSYFATVFIAAPLAIVTGVRIAPGFAIRLRRLDRVLPVRVATTVHVVVMVYFVAFIIVHVTLVLATGALRNLNHMYALRNDENWAGFWIFAASVVVMAVGWMLARPSILASIAGLTGTVTRKKPKTRGEQLP